MLRHPLISGAEGEGDGAGSPPPAGDAGQEPATPPSADGGSPPAGDKPDDGKTYTQAYVDALRAESAGYRTKAKELEDREAERAKEQMSDIDRANAELAEEKGKREAAENQLVIERKRGAILAAASAAKFLDPSDALAHIDLSSIQMTQDGEPHKGSVESAVKRIAEEKKYLISGPGSADGGFKGDHPKPDDERMKAHQEDIQRRGGVPAPVV